MIMMTELEELITVSGMHVKCDAIRFLQQKYIYNFLATNFIGWAH